MYFLCHLEIQMPDGTFHKFLVCLFHISGKEPIKNKDALKIKTLKLWTWTVICPIRFFYCQKSEMVTVQGFLLVSGATPDIPVAWGSRDRRAPRLRPPRGRKRCGTGLVGCPGPPAPWSSCASGSRPGRPSPCRCSPPCGPGSWCTWGADSWQTSWRWRFHSGLWPCGTDLTGQTGKIRRVRSDQDQDADKHGLIGSLMTVHCTSPQSDLFVLFCIWVSLSLKVHIVF